MAATVAEAAAEAEAAPPAAAEAKAAEANSHGWSCSRLGSLHEDKAETTSAELRSRLTRRALIITGALAHAYNYARKRNELIGRQSCGQKQAA